jgi:tRNA(adenine34) deaminase
MRDSATMTPDERYMREALKEAEEALRSKDRPVGALIVHQGQVIAKAHHQVKLLRDPTAHAGIIALTQAANALQSDQLPEAVVYITQEPCAMCVGAVLLSGAARLVYGAVDLKRGACGSVVDLSSNEQLNRRMVVTKDVLAGECAALLRKATAGVHTEI